MQTKTDHKAVSPQERAGKAANKNNAYRTVRFDETYPIPESLLSLLKCEYLRQELWVPLEKREGRICVLIDDPQNILKRDAIESLLKTKAVEYCVAAKEDILLFIDHFFKSDDNIVKLVDDVINEAYLRRASDIHFEPDIRDRLVNIRFRIDGECILFKSFPYEYRSAIVSRIKIMSNLDITERRLPQDGKIKHKVPDAGEIELRVATIPTQGYVEDVVLRILTRGEILVLDDLQMAPETLDRFKAILKKPYGLILLVGPTGSGKTTTAHAALHMLNLPNVKIWTVEDPVEITQKGIRQVQVHHKIGLDFSNAMRAFLRADPDIIMVGEMRDYETAKMGVDASTTGHLVLTTLHTNNAPETIVRLLDMGIDPFSFADSLLCVLAQRLVRSLCIICKEPYHPEADEFHELARHYGERAFSMLNMVCDDQLTLYRPRGCPACNGTGYRGMAGIFELLTATDNIKQMIINRESMAAIRKTATDEGMKTLLQGGILKILQGETDLIEVLSICMR
ncbi:MAG: GspE/PulE family protein [Deltaproteobacteria bacterium]|nr:GspE/PulE family protein [Deltaproteobacteria bacterium]